MYKSTFHSLKMGQKIAWVKNWDLTKFRTKLIFCVTRVYLKENSKIKDKFFKKIPTQKINKKNLFFGSKMGGVDLYTGLTYAWVNMVAWSDGLLCAALFQQSYLRQFHWSDNKNNNNLYYYHTFSTIKFFFFKYKWGEEMIIM